MKRTTIAAAALALAAAGMAGSSKGTNAIREQA